MSQISNEQAMWNIADQSDGVVAAGHHRQTVFPKKNQRTSSVCLLLRVKASGVPDKKWHDLGRIRPNKMSGEKGDILIIHPGDSVTTMVYLYLNVSSVDSKYIIHGGV